MSRTVSFSSIQTWKTCRLRHHWRYDRNLEPNRYEPRMTLGTLCHAGIEGWLTYKYIGSIIATKAQEFASERGYFEEEQGALNELAILAQNVVSRYIDDHTHWLKAHRPVVVEEPFDLKIPGTRNRIQGRFDAILKDANGLWLAEWKFPARFRSEEDVELSTQLAIYQWAAIRCGYPVIGILYNQILPRLPAIPEQNKNGTTSRKEIMTDWETYAATVRERGEDPSLYEEEMKPKLANKEFFRSYRIYRTPEQVEHYVEELVAVSRDINSPKRRVYACENSIHCGGCQYREICLEAARGRDPEEIIASAYRTRTNNDSADTTEAEPEFIPTG